MGIYVYPTDLRWFRLLRDRAPLDEVNFWQLGGGSAFARLRPGEIFLFRLKSPINRICGGGIFEHGSLFPLNAALGAPLRWADNGDSDSIASRAAVRDAVLDEIGDVGILLLLLCDRVGVRLEDVVMQKLGKNASRCPQAQSIGWAERPVVE